MTSSPPDNSRWRRPRSVALVALFVAAGLGLVGWSLAGPDEPPAATTAEETTATTVQVRPQAAPPTTAQPVPVLPVPEDPPADPHAPTPYVVHGTLSLPTIDVTQPLHEGVTLTAINHGPSHWPGSAMPGQMGNVVVAGHRTTYTKPFYDLDVLQPGDPLVFTMNDGTTWTYELTGIELVGPDEMSIVSQSSLYTATLFACHPKGSAAQRIVARFTLVPPTG